jgi:hypothetical protein
MAGEDYKVEAELVLKGAAASAVDARKVAREARNIKRELAEAQRQSFATFGAVSAGFSRVGGAMTNAGRMIGRLGLGLSALGIGAAYIGTRLDARAVRSIGEAAIASNQQVEDMTLSIAALYTEIEHVSFDRATHEAHGLYRQMEMLALASPGTSRDLADMFSMAYGPMRRAGVGMQTLLTFSRDAVAVASALHIDYAQVSRDISMMATGVAGQDVRTFRMLRSMGLITESTQEWNEMALRTPAEASRRMVAIFSRLGGTSAEQFGRTWSGLTSSLQDFAAHFGRAFSAPAFDTLKRHLQAAVGWLTRHRAAIDRVLSVYGNRFAVVLDAALGRARRTFFYIYNNWSDIHRRFDDVVNRARELLPIALRVAKAAGVLMVGLRVGGAGLSALGGIGTTLAGLGTMGVGMGGGAAAAGGGGAIGTALAAMAPLVAPVAAVFGALAAAGVAVWRAFVHFGDIIREIIEPFRSDFQAIGADLMVFFSGVWDALDPIFTFLGAGIITNITTPLHILLPVLRAFTTALRGLGMFISWWGTNVIRPAFSFLTEMVLGFGLLWAQLGNAIRDFISWIRSIIPGMGPSTTRIAGGTMPGEFAGTPMRGSYSIVPTEARSGAPGERPSVNIDQRGSRIEVHQEFRDQDPDRVFVAMRDAMARAAVHRASSPFVAPLTR